MVSKMYIMCNCNAIPSRSVLLQLNFLTFDGARDEKMVSRAIELNEQLDKLLIRHDALLSVHSQPVTNTVHDEDEVEEPDQLFRRFVLLK